jgi:hypothetical protein
MLLVPFIVSSSAFPSSSPSTAREEEWQLWRSREQWGAVNGHLLMAADLAAEC